MTNLEKQKEKQISQILTNKWKTNTNEAYAEYLERKCDEAEDSIVVNLAEAHRRTKDTSGKERYSCKTCLIKDKNGTLLIENNDVKEHWLQYTNELYDDSCRSDSKPFRFEEPLSGPPILKEEVRWAMKKAKKRRALGPDGIPIEAIKTLEELWLDLVHHLL